MKLPIELIPDGTSAIELLDGVNLNLPVCHPTFHLWSGLPVGFDYGGKPVLDYDGEPVFAELAILRMLVKSGWEGVWVETYGGLNFLREMPVSWKLSPHSVEILGDKRQLLKHIQQVAGSSACFDVYAWKGDDILFCEAKNRGKDRINAPQKKFIKGAISCGLPESSLMIAEWDLIE